MRYEAARKSETRGSVGSLAVLNGLYLAPEQPDRWPAGLTSPLINSSILFSSRNVKNENFHLIGYQNRMMILLFSCRFMHKFRWVFRKVSLRNQSPEEAHSQSVHGTLPLTETLPRIGEAEPGFSCERIEEKSWMIHEFSSMRAFRMLRRTEFWAADSGRGASEHGRMCLSGRRSLARVRVVPRLHNALVQGKQTTEHLGAPWSPIPAVSVRWNRQYGLQQHNVLQWTRQTHSLQL